jgi:hypothetical protein
MIYRPMVSFFKIFGSLTFFPFLKKETFIFNVFLAFPCYSEVENSLLKIVVFYGKYLFKLKV